MGSLFRSKKKFTISIGNGIMLESPGPMWCKDMNGDDGWRNRVFITCTSTSNNTLSYAKVFTQPLDRRNSRNDGHADPPIHRNQPPISRVDSCRRFSFSLFCSLLHFLSVCGAYCGCERVNGGWSHKNQADASIQLRWHIFLWSFLYLRRLFKQTKDSTHCRFFNTMLNMGGGRSRRDNKQQKKRPPKSG